MKMKSKILFFCLMALTATINAAPVWNMPAIRIQPNGDTLRCFVSGDEYYHRLHDADGFTIVQNPSNGWWVYADTVMHDATHWDVVPSGFVPGTVNPRTVGLTPEIVIDRDTWNKRQHRFDSPARPTPKTSGRNHGTLHNMASKTSRPSPSSMCSAAAESKSWPRP